MATHSLVNIGTGCLMAPSHDLNIDLQTLACNTNWFIGKSTDMLAKICIWKSCFVWGLLLKKKLVLHSIQISLKKCLLVFNRQCTVISKITAWMCDKSSSESMKIQFTNTGLHHQAMTQLTVKGVKLQRHWKFDWIYTLSPPTHGNKL